MINKMMIMCITLAEKVHDWNADKKICSAMYFTGQSGSKTARQIGGHLIHGQADSSAVVSKCM